MNVTTGTPLVTIAIPTRNRAASFLEAALASAVGQTYANVEIIVSDNASTDGTEKLVRGHPDERVRYFRHEPALAHHENADHCLREARGDYFLLLHDDDLIDPDFVESCIVAVGGRKVGFARTGARTIDGAGRVRAERRNPHGKSTLIEYLDAVLKGQAVTYFCNTLYNTKLLREIGGFQSRSFTYQDVIATIRMASLHERVDLEEPKASYRIHGSKLGSATQISKWCDDSLEIIDIMCERIPEKEAYFRKVGSRLLCERNFKKAIRVRNLRKRIHAYFIVCEKFRHFPFDLFRERVRRSLSKRLGWSG